MKKIILPAVLAGVLLTGCQVGGNKANEQYQDAPRTGVVNNDPADIITMPDGFTNLATKCDHGNRIYVAFHNNGSYASIIAVAKDPTCATG